MNGPKIQHLPAYDLNRLGEIVGVQAIRRLRILADEVHKAFPGLDGKTTVWHINSSAVGGGVADILNCLVPLSREVGIAAHWWVMGGDQGFFKITKSFHNALQGLAEVEIGEEMFAHYERVTALNAQRLGRLMREGHGGVPDIIVFHDPQPAGLIGHWRRQFPEAVFLWRGHLQFDVEACARRWHPGYRVWERLVGWVNECEGAIFHLPEQVPWGVRVPLGFILPSIDPLAPINWDLSGAGAVPFIHSTLSKYGLGELGDPRIPVILQNARFDPWKDPLGVIEAFEQARRCLPRGCRGPWLLLTGPLAGDDPEAHEVLAQLAGVVNGDGAIRVLPMFPGGNQVTAGQAQGLRGMGVDPEGLGSEELLELEVNVFQTRADIIVAKSLREGFGLTVTGAGYHGKPRIVSEVGGLRTQLVDGRGKRYGFLVGGSPRFSRQSSIEMTRDWMVRLLGSARLRRAMGARARRHVIRHYLPHRHLQDYFRLFLDLKHRKIAKPQASQAPDLMPLS